MPYPDYTVKPIDVRTSIDVDLKGSVEEILYGTKEERARGVIVVVQELYRDAEGMPIVSPFSYKLTKEGRHRNRGPHTTRTGFICTEKLARIHVRPSTRLILNETTSEIGKQVPTRDVCIFSAKDNISEQDVVVFIKTDDKGDPVSPVVPLYEVVVTKVYPKYLDRGRVEYYLAVIEDQK